MTPQDKRILRFLSVILLVISVLLLIHDFGGNWPSRIIRLAFFFAGAYLYHITTKDSEQGK
jgi:hypothetical protein